MREILFRGKRADNGEYMPGSYGDWVYGSYGLKLNVATGKDEEYIMESVYNGATNSSYFVDYKIIPGTAGQYTGMVDKKGKMIFEGDECTFGIFTPKNKAVVNFENARFILVWGSVVGAFGEKARHSEHLMFAENIEIIGNIHEEKEE